MPVQLRRYEQILQGMINSVVARTDLSDVSDASAFKHILAATAREIDEAYYQLATMRDLFSIDTASGEDLDARAAEYVEITRDPALKATGTVTFSRSLTTGTINIPAGTIVKTATGVQVITTALGQILNTFQDSAAVPAIAILPGTTGNVAPLTLVKFESKPPGVDTVTNPGSFANGQDLESDDSFRARIRSYIRSLPRATPEALRYIAKTVRISTGQRVVYAHVWEDPINRGEVILYIDDGAGTAELTETVTGEVLTLGLNGPPPNTAVGGEEYLFLENATVKTTEPYVLTSSTRGVLVAGTDYLLDDAQGQNYFTPPLAAGESLTVDYVTYRGLIEEVQRVVYGDPDDETNYPGWRAYGVRVRIRTPAILQQVVEATLVVANGFDYDAVVAEVRANVSEYINGLGISGDVIRNEIIERIMRVPGIYNVVLLQPATDSILLDDQLPRITAGNILLV